jgi:glycosyltransferase involved in cell wall biosynthesis
MRVLVLNYEFPPVGGGGGRASAELAQALAERGHQVQVLTSRAPGLPSIEQHSGYQIRRVVTGRRSLFRASFLSMAAYVMAGLIPGLRLISRWKPDVLHAHFAVPTGVLANLLGRLTRTRYVLTAHLGDVPGGVPEKTSGWFRWIYPFTHRIWREATAVVAVSEYTRELALRHYDVPIQLIPNGIRLPAAADLIQTVGEPPALIFAGRFQPQKNLPLLLRSLSAVQDLAWQCVLVGDGPEAENVDQMILEHSLTDRVVRTGWIDPIEVDSHLRESDILVMPSQSEGLPVIGIQALAFGLALVATRAGGLAELVEDKVNGRSCAPGDESCFVESIRWCLEDRQRLLHLKRSSRTKAARYDLDQIAEKYEAVLLGARN